MIRPLRPTDTIALTAFGRQAGPSEATARGTLSNQEGRGFHWDILLRQWLPWGTPQQAWVAEEKGTISGLISVHSSPGSTIWEVDLILLSPSGTSRTCRDLLEGLGLAGAEQGIDKVLLRLPSHSPLLDAARRAGFSHYLTELLYQCEGPISFTAPDFTLRPRSSKDDHSLFQLYNTAVPAGIRRVEGLTFGEWQEVRSVTRWKSGGQESVAERDGHVFAWLRLVCEGKMGLLELLVAPSAGEALEGVLGHALTQFMDRKTILCLAAGFQEALSLLLEQRGFHGVAQYAVLAKQLAVRVKQSVLEPVRA
ncbi:MAG: hypothetical protein ABIH46_02695 [Chloroflexota bacterium]